MPGTEASQRVRPKAGPMTGYATPFFERLWPGMTKNNVPRSGYPNHFKQPVSCSNGVMRSRASRGSAANFFFRPS